MMLRIAAAVALFGASAIGMSSQQTIHVRVVESKHLRPVTDECLNITLGKWHGAELFLPTDSVGQIALSIEDDKVSALFVPAKACNTSSISGPMLFDSLAHEISIVTDEYVSCQYSERLAKDPAWRNASPRAKDSIVFRTRNSGPRNHSDQQLHQATADGEAGRACYCCP